MSAERILQEIETRQWLSDKVLSRLRDKLGSSAPPAKKLVKFLVEKGHLTESQGTELMDVVSPPPLVATADDDDEPEVVLEEIADSGEDLDADGSLGDSLADAATDAGETVVPRKRKRRDRKVNKNEWDSPLILIGGGALVLMLLCGGGVWYLLFRGSGDELLKVADASYADGSYTQAIGHYEKFLKDFAKHEGRSKARVDLGLARLRQAAEVGANYELALTVANKEINEIKTEAAFDDAQRDLSAMLPKIATGLAEKAEAAEDLESINKYVDLATQALELASNTKYVPKQFRNKEELEQVRGSLARISGRQVALKSMQETIEAMQKATAAGDIRPAYEAHAAFVKQHSEYAGAQSLAAAVVAAVEAERAGIKLVDEPIQAETSEAATPVVATVTAANQRVQGNAPAEGVTVVQLNGVAYGMEIASGKALWRRSLGEPLNGAAPLVVGRACVVFDAETQELVLIDSAAGKLKWRVKLEETVSQPVLVGQRIFVAGASGRLHVIEAATGTRTGYVQFAQPLRTSPTASADGKQLYLVGEHSSVYSLDAKSLKCLGIHYLGHAKGSVVVSPAVLLGRVVVAENDGVQTSRLHVLGVNDTGAADRVQSVERLGGLMLRQPTVFGRRFAALTDSGQVKVFEASPEDASAPLALLAERPAARQARSVRYAAVAGGQLWIADRGLAKYSISPADNRLTSRNIKQRFRGDTFVIPPEVKGNVLIHTRQRSGEPGFTVATSDTKTGEVFWETDIAVPPAGAPVGVNNQNWLHTTTDGRVFVVDATTNGAQILQRGRLVDSSQLNSERPWLRTATSLSDTGAVYAANDANWAMRIEASNTSNPLAWVKLPGNLACEPTPFAGGWLAAVTEGQVHLLDTSTGAPLAAPFQPELVAGSTLPWLPAGVGELDGSPIAVITDGNANLFTLQFNTNDGPRLEAIAGVSLAQNETVKAGGPLTTRVAVAGGRAFAAQADGKLLAFDAGSLDTAGQMSLGAAVAWGPYTIGEQLLVATADNRLHGINPNSLDAPLWSKQVATFDLLGAPLTSSGEVILATRAGLLWRLQLATGEGEPIELHQRLATGPVELGDRLVLAATDGSLIVVNGVVVNR